jgi:hypothetical protein|tara:strand:- start:945 stop:1208 length:264 start_codon:yes stop_codon:yes gene_type:complete
MIFKFKILERDAMILLSSLINLANTQVYQLNDTDRVMTRKQRAEREEDNEILHRLIVALSEQYGVDIDFYLQPDTVNVSLIEGKHLH